MLKEFKAFAMRGNVIDMAVGVFINTVIDFTIVAFAMFLVIKQVNRFTQSQKIEAPTTKECAYCVSKIAINAKRCSACTSQLD